MAAVPETRTPRIRPWTRSSDHASPKTSWLSSSSTTVCSVIPVSGPARERRDQMAHASQIRTSTPPSPKRMYASIASLCGETFR